MDPAELERLVDRALGQLPAPRAPRTLLPRVMAAVPTPARPWYARPWLMWPAGWQIISLVVLIGVMAGVATLLTGMRAPASALVLAADVRAHVVETARDMATATAALELLWRVLLAPVVPYAFALAFLMCLACAVFGTALNHLVFGKALP
jgi:hypothetical protein